MAPFLLLCLLIAQDSEVARLEDLLAPDAVVEKLAGDMKFTEGPVWMPKAHKLIFSDIPSGKLMEWSAQGGLKVFRESPSPNGNLLDREGRLLTCRHGARDIVRTEADGKLTVLCGSFGGKRFNSPNDVAVRSDGTLWFTDPPWGLPRQREGREQPGTWVYRFDPETKEVTVLIKDLCMPNGIAFSPDGRRLYVADTGGHSSHPDAELHDLPPTVTAYAVDEEGTLTPKPVWKTKTRCDGMCVDVKGHVYTTSSVGVTVLRPDGKIIGTIETPESPANCCFGGESFKTLFITARTSLYAVELANPGARIPAADPPGSVPNPQRPIR
jgi:gluconolactonase